MILFYGSKFLPDGPQKTGSTLFSENLGIEMAKAGPMATISIAIASFIGVLMGADPMGTKKYKGRVTSVMG